jgi:hypothetical protein
MTPEFGHLAVSCDSSNRMPSKPTTHRNTGPRTTTYA